MVKCTDGNLGKGYVTVGPTTTTICIDALYVTQLLLIQDPGGYFGVAVLL